MKNSSYALSHRIHIVASTSAYSDHIFIWIWRQTAMSKEIRKEQLYMIWTFVIISYVLLPVAHLCVHNLEAIRKMSSSWMSLILIRRRLESNWLALVGQVCQIKCKTHKYIGAACGYDNTVYGYILYMYIYIHTLYVCIVRSLFINIQLLEGTNIYTCAYMLQYSLVICTIVTALTVLGTCWQKVVFFNCSASNKQTGLILAKIK